MKKMKIFSVICIALFISMISIPIISAQETIEISTPIFNKMTLAHIKINGNGNSIVIANEFILGFGRCAYIRLKLNEESHIEINKFLNKTNQVILDGNNVINIFGFIGYYKEKDDSINLNGFTALIYWR